MQSAPTFSNIGYDFVFPKLHGMWAKAVVGERLEGLAELRGDTGVLTRLLAELGIDASDRTEVQKGLNVRYIDALAEVMRLLDEPTGLFYSRMIDRFFMENLKTILHARYFPAANAEFAKLLIESEWLPQLDADALVQATSVHRFFQLLPEHDMTRGLLPVLVELDDTRDLFVAENRIERLYYETLLTHAGRLPLSVRATGLELVETEIDITNLVMVLRNSALYELPPATVGELVVPGGRLLEAPRLVAMAGADAPEKALHSLPAEYASVLRPALDSPLYVWENALWTHLYHKAYRAFRDFVHPAKSVAAFPFLKRFEALNVARVYEGVRFRLEPATIRSMLIGVQHA